MVWKFSALISRASTRTLFLTIISTPSIYATWVMSWERVSPFGIFSTLCSLPIIRGHYAQFDLWIRNSYTRECSLKPRTEDWKSCVRVWLQSFFFRFKFNRLHQDSWDMYLLTYQGWINYCGIILVVNSWYTQGWIIRITATIASKSISALSAEAFHYIEIMARVFFFFF